MAERKKDSFVRGAAVLTASTVIIKILGALFKLPLANIIGTSGMADFGVAYNIYAFLLTLSTAGLPVALSRMVSESDALGRENSVRRIFRTAFGAFLILGAVSTLIMLVFNRQLAAFMNSPEAASGIAILAPAIVCVCLMSAFRGYTQGMGNMVPTSISQIIETACKLLFGLVAAWLLIRAGRGSSAGAAGGIFGVTVGTVLALVYLIYAKLRYDRRRTVAASDDAPDSVGETLKKLIVIGVPITIGSCALNLIAIVDTKMILGRLQSAAGFTYERAKILYGIYFNTQTLYNLPSAFAVPMVTSAIPAITAYVARRQHRDASDVLGASLKLMNLLAMPMAVGMGVLASGIMGGLYKETDPVAGQILAILSAASYFVCMMMVTNAILQAYAHEWLPMISIAAGGVCKILVNYVLLGIPQIGVLGAAVGNVVCYLLITVLNLIFIRRKAPECPRLLPLFLKPLISSLVMGAAAFLAARLVSLLCGRIGLDAESRIGFLVPVAGGVAVGVVIYLLMTVLLHTVTKEELQLVPKGEKLAKLLRAR